MSRAFINGVCVGCKAEYPNCVCDQKKETAGVTMQPDITENSHDIDSDGYDYRCSKLNTLEALEDELQEIRRRVPMAPAQELSDPKA